MSRRIAVVLGLGFLGACDDTATVCFLDPPAWGIEVTAVDNQGAPVSEGLQGMLTEAAYHEDMEVEGNVLRGAYNRSGLYTVSVSATAFEPWIEQDVRVRQGRCDVLTESLTAELMPLEGE